MARPRIYSATLIAKSSDSSQAVSAKVRCMSSSKPYIKVFDKKLYISPKETEWYCEQGFTVIQDK